MRLALPTLTFSLSPDHFESTDDGVMASSGMPASAARRSTRSVLPVPGRGQQWD